MSAKAGWYPDPGGGRGLYRYWDGKAWSAATSPNPSAPPPSLGIGAGSSGAGSSGAGYGQTPYGQGSPYGSGGVGQGSAGSLGPGNQYGQQGYGASAYANYQQVQKKRSPIGWWIAGAALVVVIVVVAVIAVRALTSGGITGVPGGGGGQPTSEVCPKRSSASPEETASHPNDGRVHGGPVSYPELGDPWEAPHGDERVPFGRDVLEQTVTIEPNYQPGSSWVASILVGELQAGDGFFTPEQGSQIVVKCILGAFYGDNPVSSDVKVNKAMTIDGHEGWVVESQLSFNIEGLKAKGELLIVAIVTAKDSSGLYYASIPNNAPELVAPARDALAKLKVDG